MNTKLTLTLTLTLTSLLSLLALVGCGGNVMTEEGDTTVKCGLAPQTTIELLDEQRNAEQTAQALYRGCMAAYSAHVQELIDAGNCDEISCPLQIKGEASRCSYQYAIRVNEPSESRCGAQIREVPPGVSPEEYIINDSFADTDGDGVNNIDEWGGGSDPCVANSVDVCIIDGDLDFDHDGVINSKDEAPSCPGDSIVPCI